MHRRFALLSSLALLTAAGPAGAFTTATTDDGADLRWDTEDPVPFRFHFRGSDDLQMLELERLTRTAFSTWALVPEADVDIEEGRIYTGPAAHHDGPSEVDGQSAIFFVEGLWPFGSEVIALTSVSFASDGQILDADIAFNGADHTFTTVDAGGVKDYLSIATHEVGHFLGLAHPEPDVPSATMTAQYEDGDIFLRDLDPDDAAGIAFLYPCASVPCVGTVGWAKRRNGCALGAESPTGWAMLIGLGLAGVLVVRRRRDLAPRAAGLVVLVLLVVPRPAASTFVEELQVADLAAGADRVVLAEVVEVEARFDGIVRRTATLQVLEDWAGKGSARVQVELLGGELDSPVDVQTADGRTLPLKGTRVFGEADVVAGETVVAVLDGARVRGLAQGLFHVEDDGRVWRDLSGLVLARTDRGLPIPVTAPDTLEGLQAALVE